MSSDATRKVPIGNKKGDVPTGVVEELDFSGNNLLEASSCYFFRHLMGEKSSSSTGAGCTIFKMKMRTRKTRKTRTRTRMLRGRSTRQTAAITRRC